MKSCFIISPIGDPESDTRKRSDQVLKHIIKPVVEELEYNATRADAISEPGIITSQVIEHLINDDLVIADLTDGNPNVYYELAVRHLIRKPTVHIIQNSQKPFFDVSAQRTIPFDIQNLDMVQECKELLKKQIMVVEKDPSKIDSPISQAIDTRGLLQSDKPIEANMARVIEMLQDIKYGITNIITHVEPKWQPAAWSDRNFPDLDRGKLAQAWDKAAQEPENQAREDFHRNIQWQKPIETRKWKKPNTDK